MPYFRNASGVERFVANATPSTVPPDGVFEVPDDLEANFEKQSRHFKPAAAPRSKASTRKDDA